MHVSPITPPSPDVDEKPPAAHVSPISPASPDVDEKPPAASGPKGPAKEEDIKEEDIINFIPIRPA